MTNAIEYDVRLVAFLDILGWQAACTAAISDPELRWRMAEATAPRDRVVINGSPQMDVGPKVSQFSDSVVLSLELEGGDGYQWDLFWDELFVISDLYFTNGFYVRGGVVMGLIFHDETRVFGPALVAAYKAEQTARYPRIVVPDQGNDPHNVLRRSKTDYQYFFDFLKFSPRSGSTDLREEVALDQVRQMNNHRRDRIRSDLRKYSAPAYGPDILEKYVWFAEYFNEVALEIGIETIDIRSIVMK